MFKSVQNVFVLLITAVITLLFINFSPATAGTSSVTVPTTPIPDANDYATLAWGDPWDMNEYSDVSQYINESGNRDVVRNVNVSNGIFSGTSAASAAEAGNGWFFTLFPGYRTTIHAGKAGSFRPIESSTYNCLYIAMKTDSTSDQYRIFWFADDRLNTGGAPFGVTAAMPLAPANMWNLYKVNLATAPTAAPTYASWSSNPTWQGLRIDPTIKAGVNYSVDWVRLTPCSPETTSITFTPNNSINSVWLRPEGTSQHIRVATDVNGNSGAYNLDTQGVQPGRYYVGFGSVSSCCTTESTNLITINQTPTINFVNPTFYSGQDYATTAGNAWDMDSPADYPEVRCAMYGQGAGVLWLSTVTNGLQPAECRGGPPIYVSDPNVILNTPVPADPAAYRYLSFRAYEGGVAHPWQFVSQGSITRWIWTVQGGSGAPGAECYLVSQDIAHNVGWHVYTVDLWDTFAGSAEGLAGDCGGLPQNWREGSPVFRMRIDPNENITDHTIDNQIDWIRLTKPIVIPQGAVFPLGLNAFFDGDTFDVNLFYTTNPETQPKQHPVVLYTSPPSTPPAGALKTFLPTVVNGVKDPFLSAELEYDWDTGSVAAGEYFICAEVFDAYNTAVFCSDASITVTP